MSANMFRIGDYVYFETSPSAPYQIRRIEELIKTSNGSVEAKVMCFFRRRDIPSHLLSVTCTYSKHSALEDEGEFDLCGNAGIPTTPTPHTPSPHTRLMVSPPSTTVSPRNSSTGSNPSKSSSSIDINNAASNGNNMDGNLSPSFNHNNNVSLRNTNQNSRESNGGFSSAMLKNKRNSLMEADIKRGMLGLTEDERHQLRHRELFLTRQIETLPASQIRGKCSVTLLNEAESLSSYISQDDTFFYSLVFDPQAKTLLADKGEIRIGPEYQAEIKDRLKPGEIDQRDCANIEELIWSPENPMNDDQIQQFLTVAQSVGTFARALDCSSSIRQPSLHMSAAAASRDITKQEAMLLLHQQGYDMARALSQLVPNSGMMLCRDQMEDWSASEANIFEDAILRSGKEFNDIRQHCLPWKTLKNIVEYYYMWKTTDRYVQQKRIKAVEAECKLKQVIIPSHKKSNPSSAANGKPVNLVNGSVSMTAIPSANVCEGCSCVSSVQWYNWGPPTKLSKLCEECWLYWRRLGGLKRASRSTREDEEAGLRPVVKTRAAFYLHTSPIVQIMRRLAGRSLRRTKMARNPTQLINVASVRQHCTMKLNGRQIEDMLPWFRTRVNATGQGSAGVGTLQEISLRCGQKDASTPPWLIITGKRRLPPSQQPVNCANKRKAHRETNGAMDVEPPNKRLKDGNSLDPPLDTYKLSQLGVHTPPGLTVTPINGGRAQQPPPPPYHASHNTSPLPQHQPIRPTAHPTTPQPLPPTISGRPTTVAPTPAVPLPPNITKLSQHSGLSRTKLATVGRVIGRPRMILFEHAPDDVYFYASNTVKQERRGLAPWELRRAARRPWRQLRRHIAAPLLTARPAPGGVTVTGAQ